MLSAEYLQLCKRLEELRKHLLPQKFDPTGNYSAADYDRVRGYVALSHAEIEAFIESRCLAVASKCVDEWVGNRKASPTVISLHAICYSGWDGLIEQPTFKKPSNEISVEARIKSALSQYSQAVESNNGIKEADLKRLLIPLSIRMSDLNSSWVAAMNSFGGFRGQIAHKTSVGVLQQPDPRDLRRQIWKDLVPGLRDLDLLLSSLTTQTSTSSLGPVGRKPDWAAFFKAIRTAWNSVFGR